MKPAKKAKGAPSKFTPDTRRRLIEAVAAGVPFAHACAVCRVSYSSFCDYRNAHPEFAAQIERAVAEAIEKHLRLIIRAAENGDTASSRWFLERVHSQHFARNRVEVTGADGAPLAGAIAVYLPRKETGEPPVPAIGASHHES